MKREKMKKIIFLLAALACVQVLATEISLTYAYIVTIDQNEDDDKFYKITQVPLNGCYGVSQGPQLQQFTSEYLVDTQMGCGSKDAEKMNLNVLVCATTLASEETEDSSGFKKIILDISNCSDKANNNFITMIKTAAKRNFPQPLGSKQKEINLVLIK
jgi:hypothetical protein